MSLFKRFFVGAGYGLAGSVVQRILLAAGAIVYARLLGVQDYGIWVNLAALVNVLMTVSQFGVNTAFAAFIPQYRSQAPERIPSVVASGIAFVVGMLLVMTAVLLEGAEMISTAAYHGALRPEHVRIAAPYLVGITLNSVLLAALYGFQDFRRYSLQTMLAALLTICCSVPGVLLGGVRGLALGMAFAYLVSCVIVGRALWSHHSGWLQVTRGAVTRTQRELIRFALPTFLGGLFVAPAYWIGNLILVREHGIAASGFFGVANALAQLVLFLPSTIASPLIPILSEVAAEGNRERLSGFVVRNLRMMWCVSVPVSVLFGGAAPVLITVLYGRAYEPSSTTYVILAASNLLIALQSVVGFVLIAKRKMWQGLMANALWFCLFIAFGLWLIPAAGHRGFALSFLLSYAVYGVVVLAILRKHVDFTLRLGDSILNGGLTVLAMGVMIGLAVSVTTPLLNALLASICAAGFAAAAWRWVLQDDDRVLVRHTISQYVAKVKSQIG